jgi:hypothetical protein
VSARRDLYLLGVFQVPPPARPGALQDLTDLPAAPRLATDSGAVPPLSRFRKFIFTFRGGFRAGTSHWGDGNRKPEAPKRPTTSLKDRTMKQPINIETTRFSALRAFVLVLLLLGFLPSLRAAQFGLFTYEQVGEAIEITGHPPRRLRVLLLHRSDPRHFPSSVTRIDSVSGNG